MTNVIDMTGEWMIDEDGITVMNISGVDAKTEGKTRNAEGGSSNNNSRREPKGDEPREGHHRQRM